MSDRKLKILFISREYPPETGYGGIGSYVSIIAPALAARGHKVHVLSCDPSQEKKDMIVQGVYLHRRRRRIKWLRWLKIFGMRATLARLEAAISVYREFRKIARDVDVIEYPDWEAEGLLLALLKPKPLVVHLHTPLPIIIHFNNIPKKLDHNLAGIIEKFSILRADVITAPSKLMINKLKEINWFEEDNDIKIIPNPIDWYSWLNIPSVSKTQHVILFVGRIEPLKAPELLIKGIEHLKCDFPNLKAVFVGRNSGIKKHLAYLKHIEKAALTVGNCNFIGHINRGELPRYLSEARVVVIPSRFESFSNVALEAMASGRPVIVSDNTGIAEFVKEFRLGSVFPDGNSTRLSEAIRLYLENPYLAEEVGERARQFVRTYFDPDRIAALREQVYWEAIEHHKAYLRQKCRPYFAISDRIGRWKIPHEWKEWAIDEYIRTSWKHFYLRTAHQLLELLSRHPKFKESDSLEGIHVLDLGCTPAVSVLLACLGAQVTLLDIEPKELEKGFSYAQELGVENRVHCIQADAFSPPFKPRTFDIVYNSGFIEHFDDPISIIRLMGALTKPWGAVIALAPNLWTPQSFLIREYLRRRPKGYFWDYMGRERSYSIAQLVKLFQMAGLKPIGASAANLRRSILDDDIVLRHIRGVLMRGVLWRLINLCDWLEHKYRWLRNFGYMVGCIAIVD